MHAALHERFVRRLDVVDLEVKDRTRMIQVRPFRNPEHEPHAIRIKECHLRRHAEEKLHPEFVPVEQRRPLQIVRVHRDLPNLA